MLNRNPQVPEWDQPELDFIAAAEQQILTYRQGEMSLQAWIDWLRQALWWYALNIVEVQFGGPSAMGTMLAQQWYASNVNYLNRWAAQLQAQPQPVNLSGVLWRVQLYASAGNALQQRAMVRSYGLPELPFYPAYLTRCRMRCKCKWDIRVVPGGYDCYWQLGPAEHCPTCLARYRAARPLQVRGGLIVNAQQYNDPSLYA